MSKRPTLATWLEASGRTQRDVARALCITPAHLCNLLQGKRTPSAALALRMAKLTGLDLSALLRVRRQTRTPAVLQVRDQVETAQPATPLSRIGF